MGQLAVAVAWAVDTSSVDTSACVAVQSMGREQPMEAAGSMEVVVHVPADIMVRMPHVEPELTAFSFSCAVAEGPYTRL